MLINNENSIETSMKQRPRLCVCVCWWTCVWCVVARFFFSSTILCDMYETSNPSEFYNELWYFDCGGCLRIIFQELLKYSYYIINVFWVNVIFILCMLLQLRIDQIDTYLSHCSYHISGWLRRDTSGIGSAVSSAIAHTTQIMYFACLKREKNFRKKKTFNVNILSMKLKLQSSFENGILNITN